MLSGCNMRARGDLAAAPYGTSMFPYSVRMLSEQKRWLNVYQMMAGHCWLFLVHGDMYKGCGASTFSLFGESTLAPWRLAGGVLFSCVYLSGTEADPASPLSVPPRPEIRLHSLF